MKKQTAQTSSHTKELTKRDKTPRGEAPIAPADVVLLKGVLESLPDCVAVKDIQGRYIKINAALAKLLGLDEGAQVEGKRPSDFFPPDLARSLETDDQAVLESGRALVNREELETERNGRDTWYSTTRVPVIGQDGVVNGLLSVSRDITKTKHAEEHLQTLMDNIPDKIYFKDRHSRFIRVNRACATRFNLPDPTEAVGKTDFDFFTIEHAQSAFNDEQEVIRTGLPVVAKEELETWADGSYTWVSTTKLPLRNRKDEIVGTFGLSRDITKIKHAEEQLQTLMDNIPDKIYFKDRHSRFIRINSAMAMTHDLKDTAEAVGMSDFDFFSLDHAQEAFEDEKKLMESRQPIVGKEELETWLDGHKTWVSTTKLPLMDRTGKVIGTFGLSRDITKIKQAEEELQKSNERLERIVQERTSELRRANQGMKTTIAQLDYLNKEAQAFARTIEMHALLKIIFRAFVDRFRDAQVHLCTMGEKNFETVHHTRGLASKRVRNSCLKALSRLPARGGEISFFDANWPEHPVFKELLDEDLHNLPCYLCIPFYSEKRVLGAVQLFADPSFRKVFEMDKTVIHTLALQAALSLDNAYHYKERGEQARLQSELEIAQKIQKRFTPSDPHIPHIRLRGICLSANEVGGDYLDYFQNEAGDWVVVIADVCGKGIPAALVMTSLRSTFRTEARDQRSSKRLLCAVNNLMVDDLQLDNSFITCICMIIQGDTRTLNYTRAGHPMPIIYHSGRGQPRILPSEGIALGMLPGEQFEKVVEEIHLELSEGDKFLAYTDGLSEAMNQENQTYGVNRLMSLVAKDQEAPPEALVRRILRDVRRFSRGRDQHDDLTLFAMERT